LQVRVPAVELRVGDAVPALVRQAQQIAEHEASLFEQGSGVLRIVVRAGTSTTASAAPASGLSGRLVSATTRAPAVRAVAAWCSVAAVRPLADRHTSTSPSTIAGVSVSPAT
jgi:hypothetical protein